VRKKAFSAEFGIVLILLVVILKFELKRNAKERPAEVSF
jgi:hypothetical protein